MSAPAPRAQSWLSGSPALRLSGSPALGSRLSALGSRLSALGSRLSALGSRLSALGSRLSALNIEPSPVTGGPSFPPLSRTLCATPRRGVPQGRKPELAAGCAGLSPTVQFDLSAKRHFSHSTFRAPALATCGIRAPEPVGRMGACSALRRPSEPPIAHAGRPARCSRKQSLHSKQSRVKCTNIMQYIVRIMRQYQPRTGFRPAFGTRSRDG